MQAADKPAPHHAACIQTSHWLFALTSNDISDAALPIVSLSLMGQSPAASAQQTPKAGSAPVEIDVALKPAGKQSNTKVYLCS